MEDILNIKVTRLGRRYHARLFVNGKVRDEWACQLKQDVGYVCWQLLRWYDKTGGKSAWASASRMRPKNGKAPKGKIWGPAQLKDA